MGGILSKGFRPKGLTSSFVYKAESPLTQYPGPSTESLILPTDASGYGAQGGYGGGSSDALGYGQGGYDQVGSYDQGYGYGGEAGYEGSGAAGQAGYGGGQSDYGGGAYGQACF